MLRAKRRSSTLCRDIDRRQLRKSLDWNQHRACPMETRFIYFVRGARAQIQRSAWWCNRSRCRSRWICLGGIMNSGRGLGLQQWVNGAWKTPITTPLDSSTLSVYSLWFDRHNALWIGTEGNGIYRVYNGKVDRFRTTDGLSGNDPDRFFEDREGNLWLTTSEGVDCFHDIPVVNFSVHEGLSGDAVDSILAAHDGTVWIGNHSNLDYVKGDVVSSIGPKNGLPGSRVTSLFEDH